MKHRLFSLLLAGIAALAVHAQTDYAKLGINRRVLFTMNKNEVCDYVTTRNRSKGVDECRFYLLVIDTITDIKTDVYNGKRRFTSTVDYEPGETEDCHSYYGFSTQAFGYYTNDSTLTREDVIVSYKRGKDEYLVVGNETYGPFMDVCSDYSERRKEYITGMELHPQLKGSFHYQSKVDSLWYQHDADGMEYLLGDGDIIEPMGRSFFQSPNKKHSLRISADRYKVRLDDKSYQLDSMFDYRPSFVEAYVFDDGSCFITYERFSVDFAGYSKDISGSYYITTNGEVKTVSINQYIDIKDMSIKDQNPNTTKDERSCPYPEGYWYEWSCSDDYTCPEEYDKYGYRNNLYYERKAKITSLDSNLYYIFDDKQHKHHFLTVRGSGTIYIDGMVLKADYPMLASYNEDANCFRWVVVEGKDIVYYSYLLQ